MTQRTELDLIRAIHDEAEDVGDPAPLLARLQNDLARRSPHSDNGHRLLRWVVPTALAAILLAAIIVPIGLLRGHERLPALTPPSVSTAVPTHAPTPSPTPEPTATAGRSTPRAPALALPDTSDVPATPCLPVIGSTVTITLYPGGTDVPCAVVTAGQRLRVVNATNARGQLGEILTVGIGGWPPRVLQRGQSTTYDEPFGAYLAPGEHYLEISTYGQSHIIIWLK